MILLIEQFCCIFFQFTLCTDQLTALIHGMNRHLLYIIQHHEISLISGADSTSRAQIEIHSGIVGSRPISVCRIGTQSDRLADNIINMSVSCQFSRMSVISYQKASGIIRRIQKRQQVCKILACSSLPYHDPLTKS